jgi:nucleoside-diphosphate-sugar epimerase
LPVKLVPGDITDKTSLLNAFKGCNFVVHVAAYVKDWGCYELFHKTNVDGTLNVLNACLQNNIKNVIITGTVSVYGEENSMTVKNEDYPYNSHYKYFLDRWFPNKFNYYRDTKTTGTCEAMVFARQHGINLTILDPAWVYGEREFDTGFYEYVRSAKQGIKFVPGSKKNKFHVVYAGDLARAYYLAYRKCLLGINRIIIGNKTAELMDKTYTLFCTEAGIKKPGLLPKWIVYPVGFLLELMYTILQKHEPPLLTRSRVNMFYDNIEYSTEKAEKLLGFRSEYSLEDGIRKTIAWYKQNNFI